MDVTLAGYIQEEGMDVTVSKNVTEFVQKEQIMAKIKHWGQPQKKVCFQSAAGWIFFSKVSWPVLLTIFCLFEQL